MKKRPKITFLQSFWIVQKPRGVSRSRRRTGSFLKLYADCAQLLWASASGLLWIQLKLYPASYDRTFKQTNKQRRIGKFSCFNIKKVSEHVGIKYKKVSLPVLI